MYLEDDTVRCFGSNEYGQLGIGSDVSVGTTQGEMGAALVSAEVFHVTPGDELEGLRLGSGGSEGWLQLQYNGSYGLVCDDGFSDATAQVVCRDIGMAGGRALLRDPLSDLSSEKLLLEGTILADRLACDGTEVSLRDCSFRGREGEGKKREEDRRGQKRTEEDRRGQKRTEEDRREGMDAARLEHPRLHPARSCRPTVQQDAS